MLSQGDGDVLCQVEVMDYVADDRIPSRRIMPASVLDAEGRRR
jgi:hypothetical protein